MWNLFSNYADLELHELSKREREREGKEKEHRENGLVIIVIIIWSEGEKIEICIYQASIILLLQQQHLYTDEIRGWILKNR